MAMRYTVTVTDWSKPRGYRGSGRGWRVRCFGLPDDNWNALGHTMVETFCRTESAARKLAEKLARDYHAEIR